MKQAIIYVGFDVDNVNYHRSILKKITGEVISFKCRPTFKSLLDKLDKFGQYFPGSVFKLCYEASYIGFTLQRDLSDSGYHSDVAAATRIPKPRSKQVKTDRIDGAHTRNTMRMIY